MRGLFLKIFVLFWIAQSLIFVISTSLILYRRFPSPDVAFEYLSSGLAKEASQSLAAFQGGGCEGLREFSVAQGNAVAFEDERGLNLCSGAPRNVNGTETNLADGVVGSQEGNRYVLRIPVTAAGGQHLVYVLRRPHVPREHRFSSSLLHFAFPQLPVAIAVGGISTLALAFFLTRPVSRLRVAARELAQSNLQARVAIPTSRFRFLEGDEFVALEHDFNHMASRLQSLVEAQRMLLRDVSHELRSPLARLNVALELAREESSGAQGVHLAQIERDTQRLNQLIGQLLTLSSLESLNNTEHTQEISLSRVVTEVVADAEYEARLRQCSVRLTKQEPCNIRGNQELLHRAVEIIVRNAIRFTSPGSEIEVHLSERNGRVALSVTDYGPGIPPSELTKIFQPFYRIDHSRSAETGGFGIGLAIAERAVRLHGGQLTAANKAGAGTVIHMQF